MWAGVTTHDGTNPKATLLDYKGWCSGTGTGAVSGRAVGSRHPHAWPSVARRPDTDAVDQRWTHHQRAIADQLDAVLLVARDSGHYIQHDAAELVVLALDAVLSAVVAGDGVVRLDAGQAAAAGGVLAR